MSPELVAEGAEASIYREDGTIVKRRHRKEYRHAELDERLRKERTDNEARLLQKSRQAGVRAPEVRETGETEMVMEEVGGRLLKDVFEEENRAWPLIGEGVARFHGRDIIHGDLTTSNMILSGGEVYFIDFGLGFFSDRIEDRATDLHLLKEVLESTHTGVAEEAMEAVLEAYREESSEAEEVLERFEEVEERGRYK